MINAASMLLQPGQSLFKGKYLIDAMIGASVYTCLYRTRETTAMPVHMLRVVQRQSSVIGTAVFSEYRRRFQTELKLAQLISHPNILKVHGLDKDADTLVLVMEYASGGSLAERLLSLTQLGKQMPLSDCFRIMLEVTDALTTIHAENIVHRNLKPGKILFNEEGHVKLADLGLAQLPGEPISRLKLRQSQMPHPGTPAYMSPEQKTMSDYISPASDVYALGLILFEMLTGHVYRNARPGILASKMRPDIPAWLDQLLARMLDQNARKRPCDAAEVAKLLREHAVTSLPAPRVVGATIDAERGNPAMPVAVTQSNQPRPVYPKRRRRKMTKLTHTPTPEASVNLPGEPNPPRKGSAVLVILLIALVCIGLSVGSVTLISQAGLTFDPFMARTNALSTVEFLSRTIEPTHPRLKVTPSPTPAPATETPIASARINATPIPAATQLPALVLTPAPGVSIEFVRVSAGEFVMGSSDTDPQSGAIEKPQHKVNLPDFYITRFEVTNEQFAVFVQTTGYTPTAWLTVTTTSKQKHPASPISWVDASAFCAWVSQATGRTIQLPTEAQWEKAARGTDGRLYPWGNQPPSDALLNYDMKVKDTSPVGQYSPRGDSPYGIADMAGNVWEWTSTLFIDAQGQTYTYPYDPRDGRELLPSYAPAYHVLRGGSYLNDSSYVRSSFRGADDQTQAHKGYGFRVVLMP